MFKIKTSQTQNLLNWLKREKLHIRITKNPVLTAFVVFIMTTLLIVSITMTKYSYDEEFLKNILVEAHGMLLDILIIGVFILWLNKLGEKRIENHRYQEEIDDFRNWKSEEAALRIRGNIKRLNKNGISKIDLSYCFLRGMNLNETKLQGSKLFHADLQGAYLQRSDLRNTSANWANFKETKLLNADFSNADLKGANFQYAEFGSLFSSEYIFKRVNLYNASLEGSDLRNVKELTIEQLSRTKTLYKVLLDEPLLEQIKKGYPHLLEKPKDKENG